MLVLSRKVGEKLVIGGNITVVVSKVAGNRVTLGIEAPSDVRVIRGELEFEVPAEVASADVEAGSNLEVATDADAGLEESMTVLFEHAAVRSEGRSRNGSRTASPLAGMVARVKSDATPRLAK